MRKLILLSIAFLLIAMGPIQRYHMKIAKSHVSALALGPETAVFEDCSCTQDPLTGCLTANGWSTTGVSGGATTLESDSTDCTVSALGGAWWDDASFTTDNLEAHFCYTTADNGTTNRVWLAEVGAIGTTGVDGYALRIDATTDTQYIARMLNNNPTDLDSTVQEVIAGDCFVIRRQGDSIEVHYKPNAGAWALHIGPITDATYNVTEVGFVFAGAQSFTNMGGGSLP